MHCLLLVVLCIYRFREHAIIPSNESLTGGAILPFYKVFFCGEGIELSLDDGEPIIGFFATRVAFGKNAQVAETKAKEILLVEWECEGWSARNRGGPLVLSIEKCSKVPLLGAMIKKTSGFTFFR